MIYKLIFCVAIILADVYLISIGANLWAFVFFIVLLIAADSKV